MKCHWLTPLVLGVAMVAALALVQADRPAGAGEDFAYTSQSGCKKCHFKTHRSWKKTLHAKALDVLKPGERTEVKEKFKLDPAKDYTKDASCLACHVTGYGKTGGYPEVKDAWNEDETKLAKKNAGVGCESCHGPGEKYGAYKKDNEQYKIADIVPLGLKVPVTADNCTGCHKAESNPTAPEGYTFDFEEMKKKADAIHAHEPLKHQH